jgi:outer membrane lipoprotein-sorting protein
MDWWWNSFEASMESVRSVSSMLRRNFLFGLAMPVCMSLSLLGTASAQAPATLTAAQIIDKNVAAQGGLQAWRAVQSISFSGKLDAGGKSKTQLPFVLDKKRPQKTRVELVFAKETAVQVYDGAKGWKLRPYLGRRNVEPYSPDELKSASLDFELDGPLVDYAAKGSKVELEGVEKVENKDAYRLKLTLKSGQMQRVWIDAATFLEVKVEGTPHRMDGKMRSVSIYLRDYKAVNGLMVPYVIETAVEGAKNTHKMLIENVVVNPKLDDSLFTKPKTT